MDYPVTSIVGMSGGPVFGLRQREDGKGLYWVVAIQSWWRPAERLAFACRLPTFARILSELLDEEVFKINAVQDDSVAP